MDAGVFELKIQLFLWENNANFNVVWKFDWKFAVKLSYPSWNFESLQSNFHTPLKVYIENFSESFKAPWKFHWNFHCKISRGYESLIETFSANFQGGMRVWLQTFNQTFRGVWKFDCKLSIKVSRGMQVWLQNFNQSFKGYASLTANVQPNFQCNPKNIKDVQICWLFLFETKAIHQDLYNFFLITMIKCIIFWLRSNKPTRVCICGSHESNPTAAK